MDEMNWPPRFTFTTRGLAELYLRKYFGDRADSADVGELAALIEDCVGKAIAAEREACTVVCDGISAMDGTAWECGFAIRMRSNV